MTAHSKPETACSHAWKINLYLHLPTSVLLEKSEAQHNPCLLILIENINCLQSLWEHLFHVLTSALIPPLFLSTPFPLPLLIPLVKIMNKLQGDDKCVDNQDETQMNWKWRCVYMELQIAFFSCAEIQLNLEAEKQNKKHQQARKLACKFKWKSFFPLPGWKAFSFTLLTHCIKIIMLPPLPFPSFPLGLLKTIWKRLSNVYLCPHILQSPWPSPALSQLCSRRLVKFSCFLKGTPLPFSADPYAHIIKYTISSFNPHLKTGPQWRLGQC